MTANGAILCSPSNETCDGGQGERQDRGQHNSPHSSSVVLAVRTVAERRRTVHLCSAMKPHLQHVAKYFKTDKVADVDLIIKLGTQKQQVTGTGNQQQDEKPPCSQAAGGSLAKFPAHQLVLFGADYFEAQAQQAWTPDDEGDDAGVATAGNGKRRLCLTIDSADQLPAAEAVIAALYGVLDGLRKLQFAQLVDAVVIADRIGAPAAVVGQAALDLTFAVAAESLTSVLEALSALPAWPACLQPVLLLALQRSNLPGMTAADVGRVQRMLLAALGDLEAAWADSQLQKLLLQLPLPALELLLSSDQLRVASEDTVLYTASQYAAAQQDESKKRAAKGVLAPLVRAPHLSGSCLARQTFGSSGSLLLSAYSTQLKLLASHKLATSCGDVPTSVWDQTPAIPASWLLGCRHIYETDSVRLVWRLPVEQLAQACRDSFAGSKPAVVSSPNSSPPMGGQSWQLQLVCKQRERDGVRGTLVGFYAVPNEALEGVFCVFSSTITGCGISRHIACCGAVGGLGHRNFFEIEPMVEGAGWDAAAWASKGLPVSGELELSLHMHSVGA